MTQNLWSCNHPRNFWLCQPDPAEQQWQTAIRRALPILELSYPVDTIERALALTLGEEQFGPHHWQLSTTRRLYYLLKPFIPKALGDSMRRSYRSSRRNGFQLGWPIEERYPRFLWEVMRQLLVTLGQDTITFRRFWPGGHRFAFVLTHDIETALGQARACLLADIEEELGFRSSFNFVPERYKLDRQLMQELRDRGFEIGVHGLRHDGKLFRSQAEFMQRAMRINQYLEEFGAVGFRAPLTHRHPDWMQALQIEYDLSFFDTDPYEPIPGGTMSIWPFSIGHFMELPYTLVQDSTLIYLPNGNTPKIWLDKVDFIESYFGMALVNVHPDYSSSGVAKDVYVQFIQAMKERGGYWHALPHQIARWWKKRADSLDDTHLNERTLGLVALDGGLIQVS